MQEKNELIKLVSESNSLSEVLRKQGKSISGSSINILKNDLNNYKEIKVIMYPLYMLQGHETAIQRSLWFYNKTKNVKEQAKMLEILNKATNADIKDLVVDKKELEKYEAFVKDKTKGLMSTRVIEGTPSLILEDGTNLLDR